MALATMTYDVWEAVNETTTTLTYDTFGTVLTNPDHRVTWVHGSYGPWVAGYIKRVTWKLLSLEDLQDAYQDTLLEFYALLCRTPLPAEQYLPVLQIIARRKGYQALRRLGYGKTIHVARPLSRFKNGPADRQEGNDIFANVEPESHLELYEALLCSVEELPDRQRVVARLFVDHYHEFGARDIYQRLAEMVSAVTGKPEHPQTVKSLWYAARVALASALRRRGFDYPTEAIL